MIDSNDDQNPLDKNEYQKLYLLGKRQALKPAPAKVPPPSFFKTLLQFRSQAYVKWWSKAYWRGYNDGYRDLEHQKASKSTKNISLKRSPVETASIRLQHHVAYIQAMTGHEVRWQQFKQPNLNQAYKTATERAVRQAKDDLKTLDTNPHHVQQSQEYIR